jgi:formate dehydrogenase maturation protein FdhE
MEKIVKSSLENLTGRGVLNQKKIDSSKLANILLYKIIDDLKWDEVKVSYLNRYSTVRLVSMIDNLIDEEIKDDNAEMAFNIITILDQRFKEYFQLTGDSSHKVKVEEVDKVLLP